MTFSANFNKMCIAFLHFFKNNILGDNSGKNDYYKYGIKTKIKGDVLFLIKMKYHCNNIVYYYLYKL